MLTKMKKNFKEHKGEIITTGIVLGVGVVIGMKVQKQIDIKNLGNSIEQGLALIPNSYTSVKHFPLSMSITEIKDILIKIDGSNVADALVATVDGLPTLFVR